MIDRGTRREFLAAAGATGAAALAGCTALGDAGERSFDVGMTAVAFDPVTVRTTTGGTVVWRNTSSRGHTVTAYGDGIPEDADYFASGGYDSEGAAREAWESGLGGRLAGGETFEHTFEVPGTYNYVCIPHERQGMVGTVVVKE
jgi:plastocyanin